MALGALAWVWRFFALQAPSSAWHAPGFSQAIDGLAVQAWILGLAVHALGPRAEARRGVFGLTAAGAVLSLAAHATSAAVGLVGVQLRDARPGAVWVLIARIVGGALLCVALALALRPPESSK